MKATYFPYQLQFYRPSGTSRGVMETRDVFFIKLEDEDRKVIGYGECAPLKGLSIDDVPDYEAKLKEVCKEVDYFLANPDLLRRYPSILFGLETAYLDWQHGGTQHLFDHAFSRGEASIAINGLIWMGTKSYMQQQIEEKIATGFQVIKMKIGAIQFEEEFELLSWMRKQYSAAALTIRVDANGAFSKEEAIDKLSRLATLDIHSIEQPIKAGDWQAMAALVQADILPIALDEELIPICDYSDKIKLLDTIKPPFIILKPSLHGGIRGCNEWIALANARKIDWWITSALESNIGLNAIAQYTYSLQKPVAHGLGTGKLFSNNMDSPLFIEGGNLHYDASAAFDLTILNA